jgi:hypothetical protein
MIVLFKQILRMKKKNNNRNYHHISKIIESVATVIISLGNGIQNILIPVISVLGKTLTGLIDIIKMVVVF